MNGFDLSTISGVYVGSTQYSKIYYGSNLIWLNVPYDAEIEYLLSNGTLYIDTGILNDSTVIVDMKMSALGNNILNGAEIYPNRFKWGVNDSGYLYFGFYDSFTSSTIKGNLNNPLIYHMEDLNSYIKDENDTILVSGQSSISSFSNLTIPLFKCYSLEWINGTGSMRIHYCNITKNSNNSSMLLIPVRIGFVGYLYDKVSGLLFGNSGTGEFILGPDKYQTAMPYDSEVEYLESDGDQYIDTGIIPDGDTGIYIKVDNSNSQAFIVGCRNDNGDTRWCIGRDSTWYYGYGTNESNYNLAISTNTTAELMLNFLNSKYWRAHGSSGNGRERALSSLSFTPAYNIRLFGSAGISASYSKFAGKLYAVKISQGSNIIMDLIPVRKDGVGYMYDKIHHLLFRNNGTGNFTYGSDITSTPALYDAEIEYLETSGSAYINTELTTSQYPIKLDTEIYLTATTNEKAISGNSYSSSSGNLVFTFGVYNSKFFIWGGSTSWQLGSGTASANTWHNVQFELPAVDSRKITVNGTEYSTTTFNSTPGNGYITDNTHPVYLMYEGNSSNKIPNKARIKYAKYYIGGQLVRDFIPVRVGTVGCLYDKVSLKLFRNVYTGVFTCGPDVNS